MAEDAKNSSKPAQSSLKTKRAAQLNDALRANLAKRKAQARARTATEAEAPPAAKDEQD